ncbi:MAG: diacylglycerol kinase family protein [Candidatus Liptonbacteria bacterium]|nr:diacylglycerol kinase family protein [Candidatus Liptonbacteria bacterium]
MRKRHQNILESFRGAFRGLGYALRERNFLIQFVIGVAAVAAVFLFHVPRNEKIMIFVVVVLVLGAEMVNSAVERFSDRLSTNRDQEIAEVKEILAGAVLLFAVLSVVVGIMIFGPSLWSSIL